MFIYIEFKLPGAFESVSCGGRGARRQVSKASVTRCLRHNSDKSMFVTKSQETWKIIVINNDYY